MMHGRGWEGAAPESDAARCGVRLPARLSFFFFFMDSLRLGSIRTDSTSILADSHRTGTIRPKSSRIGVISAGDRNSWNGRNRPQSALNHAGTAEIGFEWGPNILILSFLNFIMNICCFFCVFFFVLCFLPSSFFLCFVNQDHSNVFFKNILIVKIYRKYK